MLKRLCLALAGLFAFVSIASGAGTIPGFSLTPQFDLTGKIAPGCKLYIIQAGTTSTPQNGYQDTALTLVLPNPLTCDAGGRLPQWFVADGLIKVRLTDKNGVQLFVGDNLTVVGASSGGGGGGGTVDPTTILSTGDIKIAYNTGVYSGFVRANGRTIGSSTSGATERANTDCQALFSFLWGNDTNLTVSGGRGVSAAADWAANKTITLPDFRGRALAGLDDMGNSAAGRLTSTYFGTSAVVLGAAGGAESRTLTSAQLPSSIPYTDPGHTHTITARLGNSGTFGTIALGGSSDNGPYNGIAAASATTGITINPSGGQAHATASPMMLATIYIKL